MTDADLLRIRAQIERLTTERIGMIVANERAMLCGGNPPYTTEDFQRLADEFAKIEVEMGDHVPPSPKDAHRCVVRGCAKPIHDGANNYCADHQL